METLWLSDRTNGLHIKGVSLGSGLLVGKATHPHWFQLLLLIWGVGEICLGKIGGDRHHANAMTSLLVQPGSDIIALGNTLTYAPNSFVKSESLG